MEEMESKFTGVYGANQSVGLIPHLQGVDLPVARWIPKLGEAPGVDLSARGRQGWSRGTGVDGEE
jgi:hypothetical protein